MPLALIGIHDLPAVNAVLNATATVLLIIGYFAPLPPRRTDVTFEASAT